MGDSLLVLQEKNSNFFKLENVSSAVPQIKRLCSLDRNAQMCSLALYENKRVYLTGCVGKDHELVSYYSIDTDEWVVAPSL